MTLTADLARSWRLTQDDPATEVAELRQGANSAWETFVEALPRVGIAGLLLLFRRPLRGGDQIDVGDVAGTVEQINIRETVLVTLEGRRVVIPNAKVYSDVITVQTERRFIRANFVVDVDYGTDIDTARQVALEATRIVAAALDGRRGLAGERTSDDAASRR